jgi:hypothetical protein
MVAFGNRFSDASTTIFSHQQTTVQGGTKRGMIPQLLRQMVKVPYRALFGEFKSVEPGTLIIVRHGDSVWNANKTFTGWADPDLSPQGYKEVEHAAR